MKDLKKILEVRKNNNNDNKNNNIDKKTVSVSLNEANIQNILFALAYTYKWDDEADKWKRAEYESLYMSLYKEASKTFGKEALSDLGIEENIDKVQTRS